MEYVMNIKNETINPQEVKNRSEKIILNVGGEILDWLPTIEIAKPRELKKIINRALVLNAMYQLHLNAPKDYIAHWLEQNSLDSDLSPNEATILYSSNELTSDDHYELYWSLESLWAISWATNLIDDLPFNQQVGKELAGLSPNLQIGDDDYKYTSTMKLRSTKSIYMMLDLYYRLHWWINNNLKENKSSSNIDLNMIVSRRKALEWIHNSELKWDEMALSL